jgi:hypothetical protein
VIHAARSASAISDARWSTAAVISCSVIVERHVHRLVDVADSVTQELSASRWPVGPAVGSFTLPTSSLIPLTPRWRG